MVSFLQNLESFQRPTNKNSPQQTTLPLPALSNKTFRQAAQPTQLFRYCGIPSCTVLLLLVSCHCVIIPMDSCFFLWGRLRLLACLHQKFIWCKENWTLEIKQEMSGLHALLSITKIQRENNPETCLKKTRPLKPTCTPPPLPASQQSITSNTTPAQLVSVTTLPLSSCKYIPNMYLSVLQRRVWGSSYRQPPRKTFSHDFHHGFFARCILS